MLAYHNNPQLKQQILQQLQGSGWNVFIEDFESRFGIPQVLAHLEDAIFEGLPNEEAKNWPIRFISAIQVGADLSTVWRDFAIWLLVDPIDGVIQHTQPGTDTHRVITQVATLYRDGYTQKQMRDAAVTARASALAVYDAYSAASSASYAASYAHVAFAANAASYAANIRTSAAASSAAYAAASFAAYASTATATATALASTATVLALAISRNAAYIKMSNKLIELIQKQEVKHASLP